MSPERTPPRPSTVRLTLSSDQLDEFLDLSERFAIERTDLIDLLVMIGWPRAHASERERRVIAARAERAATLLEGLIEGKAKTRQEIEHAIEPPVNVTAIRMGPRIKDPSSPTNGGYQREWMGMDLLDSPTNVWNQARGYWVAQPDAEYIVPARLSYAPYLFRTERWTRLQGSNRVWAERGLLIDPDRQLAIPLLDGQNHDQESSLDEANAIPASELDLAVADALSSKQIAFSVGASNPVVRLRQRGKQLTPPIA